MSAADAHGLRAVAVRDASGSVDHGSAPFTVGGPFLRRAAAIATTRVVIHSGSAIDWDHGKVVAGLWPTALGGATHQVRGDACRLVFTSSYSGAVMPLQRPPEPSARGEHMGHLRTASSVPGQCGGLVERSETWCAELTRQAARNRDRTQPKWRATRGSKISSTGWTTGAPVGCRGHAALHPVRGASASAMPSMSLASMVPSAS
jgi:hypothetical protein